MKVKSKQWIGQSIVRPDAQRFVSGRGRYLDDIELQGVLHVAFLRSPFARARILAVNAESARIQPGVVAVFSGADLAQVCKPWSTRLAMMPQYPSAPQTAMAIDEVFWQGEAVMAVVAASRAQAEDAIEQIEIEWEEGIPVIDPLAALEPDSPICHPAISTNLALDRHTEVGEVDAAFREAAYVASHRFEFGRQTGVPLEPRGVVACFDKRLGELTVHQSHQAPFQMQEVYAAQLSLPTENVRVICPDVGGGFGTKLHAYADELAVVAMAVLLGKSLKFQADRMESFVSDMHARDASAQARLAVDKEGRIVGLDVDILSSFGAVSCYPRSSLGEAMQALDLCGAPYTIPAFRGRVRGVFLNKVPTGSYRAVGQPIAFAIMEQLLDNAAAGIGLDPMEIRRRNHLPPRPDDASTVRSTGGVMLGPLSLDPCLDMLIEEMNYTQLRQEQAQLRQKGILRGIGLCNFVEMTSVGSGLYGNNQIRIAGKEGVRISLQPTGVLTCRASTTDQGQGAKTGIAQIIADVLGMHPDSIVVASGDTGIDPLGGGAWASRGLSLGGEAAHAAATELRQRVLAIAGALAGLDAGCLTLSDGAVRNAKDEQLFTMAEIAVAAHFNSGSIRLEEIPELTVERSYAPNNKPYFTANGIQAAHVEVDGETGLIKVLGFWVVEDCGRIINPLLVDEQLRGGVVQGIGAALYEHCIYSDTGQLTNASMADYLVPMASEMPDIHVAHVSTPERESRLGAKGVGEAGVVGSIGALWSAVNDALRPTGAAVWRQPFTPAHVLEVLAENESRKNPERNVA